MNKRIIILFLLLILILPAPVRGQEQVRLSSMQVDLWPEYDRHSLLVIYRGTLAPETSYPTDITLRIPASAGEPNAVAAKQVDGVPYNVVYDREIRGAWAYISFTTTAPEVQLEYYDLTLEQDGQQRSFTYVWPGDYSVESMAIQVQQPFNATDMRISPSLGSGRVGNDGLTYYSAEVGSLEADQTFEIEVQYSKPDDTLTAEKLPVEPSAPLSEGSVSTNLLDLWPWFLAGLGVVLVIGGLWWYWRGGRGELQPKRRRRTSRLAGGRASVGEADSGVYCHQCGKRANPGDRFCRSCGARLRTE